VRPYELYQLYKSAQVTLSDEEFLKEHARLVKVLESKTHADDRREAADQRREVFEQLGKRI
jgi:hypothetical protein